MKTRLVFPLVVGTDPISLSTDGTMIMMLGCATESNCASQHLQMPQVEMTILAATQVSLASLTSSVNP
eukprot:5695387-Amphidinium_carterae.1